MDLCACGFETRSRVEGKVSKTVHVCYSMGLSACGCETRAAPSNSLATTALFTSWNDANVLDVLLIPFPATLYTTKLYYLFKTCFAALMPAT